MPSLLPLMLSCLARPLRCGRCTAHPFDTGCTRCDSDGRCVECGEFAATQGATVLDPKQGKCVKCKDPLCAKVHGLNQTGCSAYCSQGRGVERAAQCSNMNDTWRSCMGQIAMPLVCGHAGRRCGGATLCEARLAGCTNQPPQCTRISSLQCDPAKPSRCSQCQKEPYW